MAAVSVFVGGNLNISSLQDTETYRSDSSFMGGGISVSMSSGSKKDWLDDSFRKYDSTPYVPGTAGGSAFLGKGSMDSDYASVTQQAGIYAGEGGFTVHVEDNTRLTGALLDSTASAEKNSLTTGTLTMEDMGNKAEYDVKHIGVSYHHYGSEAARQDNFNQSGLTPSISPGAQDEASSATQSAIAPGTIITTKEQTDLSQINRNTADALHKLDQIFDKKDIQERQELAQLFSKNANELLHQYDRDGTFDKALAHGIVAEISSQIAGNGAGSGFAAGFTNELLIDKIKEWSGGDPAKAQWISAALGATVNEATGNSAESGAFDSQNATKWNHALTDIGWVAPSIGSILEVGSAASPGLLGAVGSAVLVFVPVTVGEGGDMPENVDTSDWPEAWFNPSGGVAGNSSEDYVSSSGETIPQTSYTQIIRNAQIILVSSDGTETPTNKYNIGGMIFEDDGGYDVLGRRYLVSTETGVANLLSGYRTGPDGNDNWKEVPYDFDKANNPLGWIKVENVIGTQAYLNNMTYGGERIIDGGMAVYDETRQMYVDVKDSLPVPIEVIEKHPEAIIPGSMQLSQLVPGSDGFTLIPEENLSSRMRETGMTAGTSMMPPNNNNPLDFADLLWQSQQPNNQNDYSNDTSFLYAKNVSKALLEQTLNRIGGKYGASHIGPAAIKALQALEAYEGGKTLNDKIHAMKKGDIGSVGIGFSSFKQEHQNDTVIYADGTLASEGNITIAAGSEDTAKGNINAIGEIIQG